MMISLKNNPIPTACLLLMFSICSGCDVAIVPITDGDTAYSVYGTLDLQSTPNYIRIHDTGALLNPESTRELDMHVVFTNLSTMESHLLRDSVVMFENVYTHNFVVETPVEFDTRYKLVLEDADGFLDSLVTVTTRESQVTVQPEMVDSCQQYFFIEMTDIDLDAGQRLDIEIGVNAGNVWHWTTRYDLYEYFPDEKKLVLGWSPDSVSLLIWPPPAQTPVFCEDYSSNVIRFRFTHIGHVEAGHNGNETGRSRAGVRNMVVLSRYSGEAEIRMSEEI
jgi:hypothetical protein